MKIIILKRRFYSLLESIKDEIISTLRKDINKMSADVNSKLDAQTTTLAGIATEVGSLVTNVQREIQQVLDAIAAGLANEETLTSVAARLDTHNASLSQVKDSLASLNASLVADDAPPPIEGA